MRQLTGKSGRQNTMLEGKGFWGRLPYQRYIQWRAQPMLSIQRSGPHDPCGHGRGLGCVPSTNARTTGCPRLSKALFTDSSRKGTRRRTLPSHHISNKAASWLNCLATSRSSLEPDRREQWQSALIARGGARSLVFACLATSANIIRFVASMPAHALGVG
jgi:hypothetical protein